MEEAKEDYKQTQLVKQQNDLETLIMKVEGYEGEDLEIFFAVKERIKNKYKKYNFFSQCLIFCLGWFFRFFLIYVRVFIENVVVLFSLLN